MRTKVLFLFVHLHRGGMQRAVSNISLALPDQFEQHVAFFNTEDPDFLFNAKLKDFNLPSSPWGFFGKLITALRRLRAIRLYVERESIGVVVSLGEAANVYSLLSRHQARKIITSRVDFQQLTQSSSAIERGYALMAKLLYPHAEQLVAVSRGLAKQMRELAGPNLRIQVIPNLYQIDALVTQAKEPLPKPHQFLEGRRFLVNVGSLCYQKGQDELLNVFAGIKARLPDVHLVIVGRGEWEEKLRTQARKLGLESAVTWVGFNPNPYRYIARAKAFVLTSRFEGFPNVLVEAMACGVPVAAFDCPTGPSEILEDGKWGLLIHRRSATDLSNGVVKLLVD